MYLLSTNLCFWEEIPFQKLFTLLPWQNDKNSRERQYKFGSALQTPLKWWLLLVRNKSHIHMVLTSELIQYMTLPFMLIQASFNLGVGCILTLVKTPNVALIYTFYMIKNISFWCQKSTRTTYVPGKNFHKNVLSMLYRTSCKKSTFSCWLHIQVKWICLNLRKLTK